MEKSQASGVRLPNGWEIVNIIGKGSFGVVYTAKRIIGRNTEWAAVKHISVPADPDDLNLIRAELGTANEDALNAYLHESLQDMLGEYFQMKSLQGHTNIVACHDIQQIPKQDGPGYDVYIWMELLESLSSRIIKGKVDRTETIRIGIDICKALSLLKSKGIIHRDIKPQNILVNDQGDYKLGDFGSARGIKGTSTMMSMKGTFSYMSPEIMQGKPASFTSDIYSLGLVLYRLMNRNRHPFIQEGEVSSAKSIEDSNFRRWGGETLPMPVDADEELGRIILKACAYDPKDRYDSAKEMSADLQRLLVDPRNDVPMDAVASPTNTEKAENDLPDATVGIRQSASYKGPEQTESVFHRTASSSSFTAKESLQTKENVNLTNTAKKPLRPEEKGNLSDTEDKTRSVFSKDPVGAAPANEPHVAAEETQAVLPTFAGPDALKPESPAAKKAPHADEPFAPQAASSFDGNKTDPNKAKQQPRKKSRLLWFLLLAVALVAVFIGLTKKKNAQEDPSAAQSAQSLNQNTVISATSSPKQKVDLTMGTGGESDTYFALGSVLTYVFNQKDPDIMSVKAVSTGGSADNLKNMAVGKYQLAIAQSDVITYAYNGTRSFEQTGTVPNVRILAGLYPETVQIVTTDPNIKTVADLKGKRVGVGAAFSYINFTANDILAAYGIDMNVDITPYYLYLSFADLMGELSNGSVDAAFLCAVEPTASVINLNSTKSVHLISIDDEHIEKLLAWYPYYTKRIIKSDVYGIDSDCQTIAVKSTLVANASVSDEVAYAIVKTIFENKDEIAERHAMGNNLDIVFAASCGSVPYHPGAAKYYKEQGIKVKTTPKASDIKVGVILGGDANRTDISLQIEAIKTALKKGGIDETAQAIWKYGIPEDNACYDAAVDLAEQSCNIIFAASYGHEPFMIQAAKEYPDILFVTYNGQNANVCGLNNVVNAFPKLFESCYVSGVVAGVKLNDLITSGKATDPHVGYVAGFPYPEHVSGYSAFLLGIRSIVPRAHMDVMFTYSWFDPNASYTAAQSLLDKGCVIIGQGSPDIGVAKAVQDASDVGRSRYCVGYEVDIRNVAPDVLLTSVQSNLSALYQAILNDVLNGKTVAHDYALGYEADGVMISELGNACASGTAEKVQEVIAAIRDGSLHVFDTASFTVNGKTLTTYMADVYLDPAYTPDTEAIWDGYFHESEYRSAPYFDLKIDGIKLLN